MKPKEMMFFVVCSVFFFALQVAECVKDKKSKNLSGLGKSSSKKSSSALGGIDFSGLASTIGNSALEYGASSIKSYAESKMTPKETESSAAREEEDSDELSEKETTELKKDPAKDAENPPPKKTKKKPFVVKIKLSSADSTSIETIFKEALAENSMSKLLYAISFEGLFHKEGETELKNKLARLFLDKLEEKQPNAKPTSKTEEEPVETPLYLNFLLSLKYPTYSQEFSLFLMWIAANVEASTIVHHILFTEKAFSFSTKQYFLEYALSTRNKYIFEALAVFLEKFYQGPAVASDNLSKALGNCSELQMYDFLDSIFTKDLHTKYSTFYWRLEQLKLFANPQFDSLVDREFHGKAPDKTFAPLVK